MDVTGQRGKLHTRVSILSAAGTSKHNAPVLPYVCVAPRCAKAPQSGGDHPDTIYRLPASGFSRLCIPRSGAHSLDTTYRAPASGVTYPREKSRRQAHGDYTCNSTWFALPARDVDAAQPYIAFPRFGGVGFL
ncbi:hypothetical protein DFH06DRAFT_1314385 [Mycena polygramma]|nr:hypothetical protein DFH06DRAFT_1314381 [Mycena polygramma]KAJ7682163.1 hypothetical protein DFH06DRAFT_1314385 [Mycena polygramma]